MKLLKFKRKGISLIETLLVLSVLSVLSIGSFVMYSSVSSGEKLTREISNIKTIQVSIKSLFAYSPDYNELNNDVVIESNILPTTMIKSDNELLNIFKGKVEFKPYHNNYFMLNYDGVPESECVKIVAAINNEFESVIVNEVDVVKDENGRFYMDKLAGSCQGNNNIIQFISS